MTGSTDPLDLLANEAQGFGATVSWRTDPEIQFDVELRRADGRKVHYRILARNNDAVVTAREWEPRRLPAFCPERHINHDGTFCLYWAKRHRIEVVERNAAIEWWNTLVAFLSLQERASNLGRWPDRRVWAHGDAAQYQHMATESAVRLGSFFPEALADGRLTVELCPDMPGRGKMLRLRLDARHLCSVLLDDLRVANGKQPCICTNMPRRKPLRACSDHASAAAQLACALHLWDIKEREFWAELADKPCCAQMAGCPLHR
ncbi:E2 domain-containing protein [Paraburkholderia phenoliruptrix]|uniref:E2 domain-containing protein n=1 Tax=Paraburkholderia phenoliruptrix TaxID=252970 RepID=UPI002869CFFD|nr:E2 domain-containing protein [Paraburkholderia phenoliruptrix]WMY09617.1 hypothetical protein P3F88_07585 [Paraburkholderia phenoliruptrix]